MRRKYQSQLNQFGTFIHDLRQRAAITQLELAEKCSVDIRTIRRIEKGEIAVGLEILLTLAKVFKMQPAELLEPINLKVN